MAERSTAVGTGNYFRVLGSHMERGREFMPAEDLLLAPAATRREEIAARLSVGAIRPRIVLPALTQSLLHAVGATLPAIFVVSV